MAGNKIKILIVDDNIEFVDDFKTLLPSDLQCLSASSAETARYILDSNEIDLVFLDIDLGAGMNGLEFLEILKKELPYLPIIMITADQNLKTVVRAMHLGASDYVGKHPDLDKMKISIEKAIAEKRLHQRLELVETELADRVGELIGESTAIIGLVM